MTEAQKDAADAIASGRVEALQCAIEGAREPTGPVEELMHSSGLATLRTGCKPDEIDAALRRLSELLDDSKADALRRRMARESAIDRLEVLEVRSPVAIVNAALNPGESPRDATTLQGQAIAFPPIKPWTEEVDGSKLLDDLAQAFLRFLALSDFVPETLALWTLHAHALDAAQTSPRLAITSPTKRCGKTRLLNVLHALVPKALPTSNVSSASLFRAIEKYRPTLLIDEADSFFEGKDELRGILNSGHTRATGFVMRAVGDDNEPATFSTWAAVAIAMIGKLPETLADRSVPISIRRRAPGEHIERLRGDRLAEELSDLRRRAARWAADQLRALRDSDPAMPDGLDDRAADNWRPLLAIADASRGKWPDRAREAARVLAGARDETDDSKGVLLLADVRATFDLRGVDKLPTEELLQGLTALEESPWATWNKGKPLSAAQLARLLKPFEIAPRTIRLPNGKTPKGYHREDFEDVFSRYFALETATTPQPSKDAGSQAISQPPHAEAVAAAIPSQVEARQRCGVVAAANPESSNADPRPRSAPTAEELDRLAWNLAADDRRNGVQPGDAEPDAGPRERDRGGRA